MTEARTTRVQLQALHAAEPFLQSTRVSLQAVTLGDPGINSTRVTLQALHATTVLVAPTGSSAIKTGINF